MKKRFPNLDGLRFYAAFLVLLTHIEVFKIAFGYPSPPWKIFNVSSHLAVTFFFVLSGFLISWYLMEEKKIKGSLNLAGFYKRRMARIWPLYYLLLVLNFFFLSRFQLFHLSDIPFGKADPGWSGKLLYCFFLAPNLAELRFGDLMYMKISWSVAAEECFYIFLPVIIQYTPMNRVKKVLVGLFIFFAALSLSFAISARLNKDPNRIFQVIGFYAGRYRLFAFAAGALAAWFYSSEIKDNGLLRLLRQKSMAAFLLFLFFMGTILGITFSDLNHQLYALFFALLIFSLCTSGLSPWFLNNRLVRYLGKISYGIYMLHPIIIVFVLKTGANTFIKYPSAAGWVFAYMLIFLLTFIASACSYEFFEKRFLRFRELHS